MKPLLVWMSFQTAESFGPLAAGAIVGSAGVALCSRLSVVRCHAPSWSAGDSQVEGTAAMEEQSEWSSQALPAEMMPMKRKFTIPALRSHVGAACSSPGAVAPSPLPVVAGVVFSRQLFSPRRLQRVAQSGAVRRVAHQGFFWFLVVQRVAHWGGQCGE